jgi:hypothetical protein
MARKEEKECCRVKKRKPGCSDMLQKFAARQPDRSLEETSNTVAFYLSILHPLFNININEIAFSYVLHIWACITNLEKKNVSSCHRRV